MPQQHMLFCLQVDPVSRGKWEGCESVTEKQDETKGGSVGVTALLRNILQSLILYCYITGKKQNNTPVSN